MMSSCVIQQNRRPFEWVVVVTDTLSLCCLFLVKGFVCIGTIKFCAPWIIRSMASIKLIRKNRARKQRKNKIKVEFLCKH